MFPPSARTRFFCKGNPSRRRHVTLGRCVPSASCASQCISTDSPTYEPYRLNSYIYIKLYSGCWCMHFSPLTFLWYKGSGSTVNAGGLRTNTSIGPERKLLKWYKILFCIWNCNLNSMYEGTWGALGALSIVWCTSVASLMILVDTRKQERSIVHNNNIFCLIGLQQPLILGPGHVLERRIRFYVALHYARESKWKVLHCWRERYFCWIC